MAANTTSPTSFENVDALAYDLRTQDPTQDWDIGGIDRASELGALMGKQGITSLSQMYAQDTPYQQFIPGGDVSGDGLNPQPDRYEDMIGKQWSTGGKDDMYGFLGDYNNDGSFGTNSSPYMQNNNLVGWSARGDGNVGYHLNNNMFTPAWGSSKDSYPELATALGLGMMFVPGMQGFGAALGQGLGLSGTLASVAGNSLIGGGLSALGGGDFKDGALSGALNPLLGDLGVGSALGITDPYLLKGLNGAISGGVGSALQGGNIGQGALRGAAAGGLNAVGAHGTMGGGDMYDLPGTMSNTDMYGESSATMGGAAPTNEGNYYNAPQMQPQANQFVQGPGGGSSGGNIFSNGIPNFSGGNVPIGDALGGLLGLYERYDARKQNKNMMRSLQDMYSPNSAYAQQLKSSMARQDAASGRRSQYGARETDFMAKMADVNMRMAPTLMQLQQQNRGYGLDMIKSGLSLGSTFGVPGFGGQAPGQVPAGGYASTLPSLQAQQATPPPMQGASPNYLLGEGYDSFVRGLGQKPKLGGI